MRSQFVSDLNETYRYRNTHGKWYENTGESRTIGFDTKSDYENPKHMTDGNHLNR